MDSEHIMDLCGQAQEGASTREASGEGAIKAGTPSRTPARCFSLSRLSRS